MSVSACYFPCHSAFQLCFLLYLDRRQQARRHLRRILIEANQALYGLRPSVRRVGGRSIGFILFPARIAAILQLCSLQSNY